MLKRFCDCCESEIKGNESPWKVKFNRVRKDGNLARTETEYDDMDFCEKCVERIQGFIGKMGKDDEINGK